MNTEILNYCRQELLKQKQAILDDANKTLNSDINKNNEGMMPDTIDRSALETDRNFILRLRDRERKLLKKINEAIQRIDVNEFGICENCGEDIDENRLKARPVTTQCIECKETEEREEKMRHR